MKEYYEKKIPIFNKTARSYSRLSKPGQFHDSYRKEARFTIIKEVEFYDDVKLKLTMKNLERLYHDDFGPLKVPHFVFKKINNNTLQISSEYIKGRYVNKSEMETIKQYALLRINDRQNLYTLADLHPNNWIVEGVPPYDIYGIDLDSYYICNMQERWIRWNRNIHIHKEYQKNQLYIQKPLTS